MRDNFISSNEGAVLSAVASALAKKLGVDLADIEVTYRDDKTLEVTLNGEPIDF